MSFTWQIIGILLLSSAARDVSSIKVENMYCESPGLLMNGRVLYFDPALNWRNDPAPVQDEDLFEYPEESMLEFLCDEGYKLQGRSYITCQSTGLWSGSIPQCVPGILVNITYCENPGVVLNGRVEYYNPDKESSRPPKPDEDQAYYPEEAVLKYSCDDGHKLQGSSSLICLSIGFWSDSIPQCVAGEPTKMLDCTWIVHCKNPGLVLNGRVRYSNPDGNRSSGAKSKLDEDLAYYPVQTVLEYSCDEGFKLQGRSAVTCQSTGLWSGSTPQCVPDCGRSYTRNPRDIRTTSGDWPWVVFISIEEPDGRTILLCGGAVISAHTVITAAHCLTAPLVDGKTFVLRFGKHHFNVEDDDDQVLVRRSSRTIIHPHFSNRTMDSDIGLVIFEPKIGFSRLVQPLCLPNRVTTIQNVDPGKFGFISGWGLTEDLVNPDVMMLKRYSVVSDRRCMDVFREQNLKISSNMFCAGHEDNRMSICEGDSGSAFVFFDERRERYILEGLVSTGTRGQCGVAGKYAIFTKVFRFLSWILKHSK